MKARKKRKRLLMFGDRYWKNEKAIERILKNYEPNKFIILHGDNGYDRNGRMLIGRPDEEAVRGADKLSGKVAARMGFIVRRFPANWHEHGPAAGPMRNRRMAREGKPDEAVCLHEDLSRSRGSKDMIEVLDAAEIPWKQVKK